MANTFKLSYIIKGIILAAFLAVILSLGFGLLLSFTSIPESDLSNNIIYCVSVFIAAFFIAYRAGNRGMIYGIGTGIAFLLLLLLLNTVLEPDGPSWLKVGEKGIFAVVAGGVGGAIGVLFHRA